MIPRAGDGDPFFPVHPSFLVGRRRMQKLNSSLRHPKSHSNIHIMFMCRSDGLYFCMNSPSYDILSLKWSIIKVKSTSWLWEQKYTFKWRHLLKTSIKDSYFDQLLCYGLDAIGYDQILFAILTSTREPPLWQCESDIKSQIVQRDLE